MENVQSTAQSDADAQRGAAPRILIVDDDPGIRDVVSTESDGWTVVTRDRKLSAQFEHTVAVTATGVDVLTLRRDEIEAPRAGA